MLLIATFLSASNVLVIAQDARDKSKSNWPTESKSVVKKTTEGLTAVTLSDEPVMRIALSTGTSAATISTTAPSSSPASPQMDPGPSFQRGHPLQARRFSV